MDQQLFKKVFITGGTGSVGKSLVKSFTLKQFQVHFQYNKDSHTAKDLSLKYHAHPHQIDFFNNFKLPDIEFDIIINNAGINITDALTHEVSDNDWANTIQLNLQIPFLICRKYLPFMIKSKWGRIINISSIYGLRATEQNLPYTVSKHGLTGITQTIAKEYAQFGISCNEICPAAIESNMMNQIANQVSKKEHVTVENFLKDVSNEIPAKRMAKPCEIASLAKYLASEEAGFINGTSIAIDGGLIC